MKNLGEKIKVYRHTLGLSQKELARQIEIDPSTIGNWEKNKSNQTKKLYEKLKVFFIAHGLTIDRK